MKRISLAVAAFFLLSVGVPARPAQAADVGLIVAAVFFAIGGPFILMKALEETLKKGEPKAGKQPEKHGKELKRSEPEKKASVQPDKRAGKAAKPAPITVDQSQIVER